MRFSVYHSLSQCVYVRTFSLLGDKGEGGAISRPLGALPLSAVGEAGERIFGEDGAVITAALTGFERLCERLWERACVGVVPPLPPVECKLQFLGVEVPDAVNLPCATPEQSRGQFG